MENDILKCNICAKSFSGVVPYSQHMQSAKHLKKQKQVESELVCTLPTTEEGKLFCETCDMKFSGVIPYTQHMNGSVHHKNVRRQKLMNDLYNSHKINKTHSEALPLKPDSYALASNTEGQNFHLPHSSHSEPFNMTTLHDQLPDVERTGQSSGASTPSYTLWNKVNNTAPAMDIPQVTRAEGKLNGCGICGISFFNSPDEHIAHLESTNHFVKKLMSLKSKMSSGNVVSDSAYGPFT